MTSAFSKVGIIGIASVINIPSKRIDFNEIRHFIYMPNFIEIKISLSGSSSCRLSLKSLFL